MEIPVNDNARNYKDEVITLIYNDLQKNGTASFSWQDFGGYGSQMFIEAAKEFVKKGYYAKVCEWCGWHHRSGDVQRIEVSKHPLSTSHAALLYSYLL